ncbi:uncharacterized protein LOC144568389 isoform X1 [Carex rostrata]
MARSPAQSLQEKSGSPIARSDPKRGGHELASNEMVLSDCYTKKDHGLKRAREDNEPRVWKYRPMSPDDCQEAYDYTPTGAGATTRYIARYGGFALRTSFRSFTGCHYQEKKFKRARQDSQQRLDDKTVENELYSPSTTTCTEYWPYSSELSPSSPLYVPSWSYSPRSSGTPPYVPGCWSYSPTSPNHCQEAQGTGSTIRDSEQTIDEKGAEGELKSPEYSPSSYGLQSR